MAAKKAAKSKATKKIDLYKEHAAEYVTPRAPVFVNVGPAIYLTIDGKSAPEGPEFTAAVGAMYNVAFTVKMARKFAGSDYSVAKLEALWWTAGATENFMDVPRTEWQWKVMIRIPAFITAAEVKKAIASLIDKGKPELVKRVSREVIKEGRCVQVLHVGPYADEPATLQRMSDAVSAAGKQFTGKHHEIYFGDPRRVAPSKLRTILRHPVR